ncbi:hypothetical protein MJO28_016595 [Puccinia striiformis f. sp. tritici]|uniref:Uncharacterized protein n=1 Tax=Puccinia striiformis f. sp. tritici TaxID=168172 RepID=A0ACC0DQ79_9BASI|nr:hypothetical protein MJO28_016595 [Puccinia striiformis f. sp. tritici]
MNGRSGNRKSLTPCQATATSGCIFTSTQDLTYFSDPPPQISKLISLACLITLLSVMVAVSRIEEVTDTKSEDADAKWFDGDGVMRSFGGFNLMKNMWLYGSPWINNWAPFFRRGLSQPSTQLWSTTRCVPSSRAAQTSHEKIVSTAQSGTYKIYLVSSKNKVVTKQLGTNAPESCQQHHKHLRCKGESTPDQQTRASQRQTGRHAPLRGLRVYLVLYLVLFHLRQLDSCHIRIFSLHLNSDPLS